MRDKEKEVVARKRTRWVTALALASAFALATTACTDAPEGGSGQNDDPQSDDVAEIQAVSSAPTGITLDKSQQTITSASRVDLTRDFATLPLHKGTVAGETVWYVITDVSDAKIATEIGVNFAPKLANAGVACPACVQEVVTSDPILGREPVEFQGAPDFSPTRTVEPGPTAFPAQTFTPGAVAGPNYSSFVTVDTGQASGIPVVFNAPIIATGDTPSDVTTHTDTHDRTLGIDMDAMTVDLLFVRGFANGESILYLSFDSSDAFTATLERSTFVPALADLPFQNGGGHSDSARASIFTFVNAKRGLENNTTERGASQGPGRSQGLMHAMGLDIVGRDAAVENPDVLETLAKGADVSNVFDTFPTNTRAADRAEYSPAWDLNVGVYTAEAVSNGINGLQTDANVIRRMVRKGIVTAPGGLPLGSVNVVINCPALAFLDEVPLGPRVPSL